MAKSNPDSAQKSSRSRTPSEKPELKPLWTTVPMMSLTERQPQKAKTPPRKRRVRSPPTPALSFCPSESKIRSGRVTKSSSRYEQTYGVSPSPGPSTSMYSLQSSSPYMTSQSTEERSDSQLSDQIYLTHDEVHMQSDQNTDHVYAPQMRSHVSESAAPSYRSRYQAQNTDQYAHVPQSARTATMCISNAPSGHPYGNERHMYDQDRPRTYNIPDDCTSQCLPASSGEAPNVRMAQAGSSTDIFHSPPPQYYPVQTPHTQGGTSQGVASRYSLAGSSSSFDANHKGHRSVKDEETSSLGWVGRR